MRDTLFTDPDQTAQGERRHKPAVRDLIVTFVLNAVLPFFLYLGMKNVLHQSDVVSLLITALPPALVSFVGLIRQRRLDWFAGIVLFGIVVGLLASFVSKDPRLLLIRDAFFTGVFGLALLVSLFFPKPLTYYAACTFRASFDPEQRRRFPAMWQEPSFRTQMRVRAAIWGTGLLIESVGHASLVFLLSPTQFLALSPFFEWGMLGTTFVVSWIASRLVQKPQASCDQAGPRNWSLTNLSHQRRVKGLSSRPSKRL